MTGVRKIPETSGISNELQTANTAAPTSTKSGTMVEDLHGEASESIHGFDSKQTYSSIYFLSDRHWNRARNRTVRLTHPVFCPKRHVVKNILLSDVHD
jgi:hypothetical protein